MNGIEGNVIVGQSGGPTAVINSSLEEGDYVTSEFVNYVRPLIQAELTPIMTDGLPRHLYYTDVEKHQDL